MDPSGNEIGKRLRLKRYEQPPPGYFENFLHEFRRRRHEKLVRQPLCRIWFERAEGFASRFNIRSLASASVAVVIASAAVFSIKLYQQPATQLAVQGSPVPNTPANAEKELDFAPPEFNQPFDMRPTLLPDSRDVSVLPIDFDQFVPLKLEWRSLEKDRWRVMRREPLLNAPSAFTGLE